MDIYRYCFSLLKCKEEAQDAMQETFVKCVEAENSFKGNCSQKTWLLVIARNNCLNKLKSPSNNHKRMDDDFDIGANNRNLELKLTLEEALKILSDEQRELIFLVDYFGYKYQEVVELTGNSLENVKIKIFRTRQQLRRFLEER